MSDTRCDAEVADRVTMRTLPEGRLAWKGCRRMKGPNGRTVVTKHGTVLNYCAKHAHAKGHGGEHD